MAATNILTRIINAYSKRKNIWEFDYDSLLEFIHQLILNDENDRYSVFETNTDDILTAMLIDLEKSGDCKLVYEGSRISLIQNTSFQATAIEAEFAKVEANSDYPFPTENSINIRIPEDSLFNLNMPDEMTIVLNSSKDNQLYRLKFSNGINNIIAPGAQIKNRLLSLAVNKMRNYLVHKNNSNYIYHKMIPLFKQNTRALGELIKMIQGNPGRAVTNIRKPDEFIFTFWTQLSAFIRKELADKENKTSQDEGILHSSILVHGYLLYYKGIVQRQKLKESALKSVGDQLKKEPFYYSISDIYDFKDKSGPYLNSKFSKKDLHDFIEGKLKIKEDEILPELVKIKTVDKKIYYIHKSSILTLAHRKVANAHDFYRKKILDNWIDVMNEYRMLPAMTSDDVYHAELVKDIKKEDPLLFALLSYELLYLAMQESKNIKLKAVVQGWMEEKAVHMKPISVILDLRRKDLYSVARSSMPFWMSFSFLRKLVFMFRGNRKRKVKKSASEINESKITISDSKHVPRSTASGSVKKVPSQDYKKGVELLKLRYNYTSFTIENTLTELQEEWNPLLDYEARNNLVKDVKNMVRDYMRKILRETAFAVPDPERVENIAELLSRNSAFNVIKKKEKFRQYLSLYIIKVLNDTKP